MSLRDEGDAPATVLLQCALLGARVAAGEAGIAVRVVLTAAAAATVPRPPIPPPPTSPLPNSHPLGEALAADSAVAARPARVPNELRKRKLPTAASADLHRVTSRLARQ
jgi:hypothetical protein